MSELSILLECLGAEGGCHGGSFIAPDDPIVVSPSHSHKVPGSIGSRNEIEERGTLLMRGFYTVGTKMTLRTQVGDDVSGSRDATTIPVCCDYAPSLEKYAKNQLCSRAPDRFGAPLDRVHVP
jgi:hypothetical protein